MIVYLNGQYIPKEQATISIMDRGFLFGDGIYEVIPSFDGQLFGFDEHMERLEQSLAAIHMKPPLSRDSWKKICQTLLEKNNNKTGTHNLYLQITRGADDSRDHAIPHHLTPTVVAFCTHSKAKSTNQLDQGFHAITLDDTRRKENYIKAITLLPNILLYEKARQAGAIEALLVRNKNVLECTSSNFFIVKDNTLYTPPLNKHILGGVTRHLILEVAKENNIAYRETHITMAMLHNADEVWVTGSSKGICPITTLDDKIVGAGKAGPMWHIVHEEYVKKTKSN